MAALSRQQRKFRLALNDCMQAGRLDEAWQLCRRFCRRSPRDVQGWLMRGLVEAQLDRHTAAVESLSRALQLAPDHPDACLLLGKSLMHLGRHARAAEALRRACAAKADFHVAEFELGNVCTLLGELEQARSCYRRVLARGIDRALVYFMLSRTGALTEGDDIAAMEALLAEPSSTAEDRCYLHFALYKSYDGLGDYQRAFHHLAAGNRLKRASLHYDGDEQRRLSEGMERAFPGPAARQPDCGDAEAAPIFVLGMPRSGTTLVEQILACHPRVRGGGELQTLSRLACAGVPLAGCPQRLAGLEPHELRQMAMTYLQEVYERIGGEGRFTDKMPKNFLYIGLIRELFPNAKVVHCRRSPVATCFSIFEQLFSGGIDYAYSVEEVAAYYAQYARLMAHWHRVLPGYILDLDYEALVDDQQAMTRRLLDFCELEWDPSCLNFHDSGRAVATSSALQVRRPLYRSALGKWRHYRPYLGELLHALQAHGVPVDEGVSLIDSGDEQ